MRTSRRTLHLTLDVSPLLDPHWTGIPVFTRRLANALLRENRVDMEFSCGTAHIPNECVRAVLRAGSGVLLHEFLAEQPKRFRKTHRDRPLLFPSVKRTSGHAKREASTVHDLSTLLMPETHLDTNVRHHLEYFAAELRTDEVVFCASEATRSALTTLLPGTTSKARVLHQYVDWPEEFAALEQNLPRPRLDRYALVMGTIEPRKNLTLILDALGSPELLQSDIRLVVVGRMGWKTEQLLEDLTPPQRERIQFTGFVSEFVKYRLLRHCEFLVFPSLYEGFGIPALEAMSLGKPVLASRTSSFPEVIGRAGLYFDPLSASEFAATFADMAAPEQLSQLSRHALRQSTRFTSRGMAAPVINWVRGSADR